MAERGTDAIRVELEHAEGVVAAVFLAYTRSEGGEVEYLDLSAEQGSPKVFASP